MDKKFKCLTCEKEYMREPQYTKHKITCFNLNDEIELENVSLKEIVVELIKQNKKMEKDINELKRWVQTKKRKIVIIDWLNKNYKLDIDFNKFISEIKITEKELEIVFNSNIVDGIQEIFENHIKNYKEIPLKSFEQKNDIIYIFNDDKWELLLNNDYNEIISNIYKEILTEFKKWQDKNQEKIYTENFSEIYLKNVKKIMGGDIPIEKQKSKIHKNLYKLLKVDLQNTIEYEFN